MNFWTKLSNIFYVNRALTVYLWSKDLPKLERRLHFLETGCHPEVKESMEYWAITELYKRRIKKLKDEQHRTKTRKTGPKGLS